MKNLLTFDEFVTESYSKYKCLKTNVKKDQDFSDVSKILNDEGIHGKWSSETGWLIFNSEADKKRAESILMKHNKLAVDEFEGSEIQGWSTPASQIMTQSVGTTIAF